MVIVNNPYVNSGTYLEIWPNSTPSISHSTGTQGSSLSTTDQIATHTGNNLPTSSTVTNSFALFIRQYANATYGKAWQFYGGTGNSSSSVNRTGFIQTATAITSLRFGTANGTSTFSGGQVLIYGVK
jgi:hypothetical protein